MVFALIKLSKTALSHWLTLLCGVYNCSKYRKIQIHQPVYSLLLSFLLFIIVESKKKMDNGENPRLPRKLTRNRSRFIKERVAKRGAYEHHAKKRQP